MLRCIKIATVVSIAFFATMVGASAQQVFVASGGVARSEFVPNFLGSTEHIFLNRAKENQEWVYRDNSSEPGPTELDVNGYPLYGATGFSHSGFYSVFTTYSQAERPGHYVETWTGGANVQLNNKQVTSQSFVACTGTISGQACNNEGCSAAQGYLSGGNLVITVASSCNFVQGQPVSGTTATLIVTSWIGTTLTVSSVSGTVLSGMFLTGRGAPNMVTLTQVSGTPGGAGIYTTSAPPESPVANGDFLSATQLAVNKFGVPTIITNTNGNTGVGTYAVNFSQTVGSSGIPVTINPGGRGEFAVTDYVNSSDTINWWVLIESVSSGNALANLGIYHINDEPTYWTGQLVSPIYKWRVAQANFKVMRDLNLSNGNLTNCAYWSDRKPGAYWSYQPPEMRNSTAIYAGAGSITYNSGTDTFSITLGSGNWQDKQLIIGQWPATGTTSSLVSLNGNPGVPIVNGNMSAVAPSSGAYFGIRYDATLNPTGAETSALMMNGGTPGSGNYGGLSCFAPPEAVAELSHELGVDSWFVLPYLALDPMTDWVKDESIYMIGMWPSAHPTVAISNELWNCTAVNPGPYTSAKTRYYIATDSAWHNGSKFCGSGGNVQDWTGKIASTVGQDLLRYYTNGRYTLSAGVQTSDAANASSTWNDVILSTDYVNQTVIPVQSGYTQTPAYKNGLTRIDVANYWSFNSTTGNEISSAWCYFYQASGCASQQNLMVTYFGTPTMPQWPLWYTWAVGCAGGTPCSIQGLDNYEGGPTWPLIGTDDSTTVGSATNASVAVITLGGSSYSGACFPGMTVTLSSLAGGTWSTADGPYTVQSGASGLSCPINLNSTSLGTLTGGTITFTGSADYVSNMRGYAYLSQSAYQWTLILNQQIAGVNGLCGANPCSINPSQFNLASPLTSNQQWGVWWPDMIGYFQIATCSACNTSGTSLTLGGTISGIFTNGLVVFGEDVANPGTGASSQTTVISCSLGAGNSAPCGSTAGDVLTLSQAVVNNDAGIFINGNVAPLPDATGTTSGICANVTPLADQIICASDSPDQAWRGWRQWNGNIGGFLLKRDLDPASNDNTPMWMNKAA